MGRTIVADERVQKVINGLKATKGCSVGLLIGQMTQQRDYILHLSETPNGEGNGEAPTPITDPKNIDDRWVATHAKQVLRMLPGGLDVLGIFVMSTQEMMTNAQIQLRKVLNAVQKVLDKTQASIPESIVHTDRIILQICMHTKKTCDVADMKSSLRPAEWKVQSVLSGWIAMENSISVDLTIPVNMESMSQTLNKQIQTGISPLLESIASSIGMFDGRLRELNELVIAPTAPSHSHSKKGKKASSNTNTAVQHNLQVDLLMRTPPVLAEDIKVTDCGAKMLLKGRMSGRAYVHGKSTYQDALNALKRDFCRTLIARCELLCEDLLQAEEEQDPRVLYETPIRVFGRMPDSPVCLCDYMFQDEVAKDSLDRFKEILGLTLTEDDLLTDLENIPNEECLEKVNDVFPPMVEENPSTQSSPKRRIYDAIGIIGSSVAAVAALMYYMYLGDQ